MFFRAQGSGLPWHSCLHRYTHQGSTVTHSLHTETTDPASVALGSLPTVKVRAIAATSPLVTHTETTDPTSAALGTLQTDIAATSPLQASPINLEPYITRHQLLNPTNPYNTLVTRTETTDPSVTCQPKNYTL